MSQLGMVPGLPGMRTPLSATPRIIFKQIDVKTNLARGKIIDGANARDTSNSVAPYVLQAGTLMGKITSSGLYGASVIGTVSGALSASATSITTSAAAVTEVVRRIGSSGTITLTGPPVASGVVRQLPVVFSAATGTTITITAPGVNEVQTMAFSNSPVGTFTLTGTDSAGLTQTTAPITYNGTAATLVSNMNTALNAAFGTSGIVAAGSAVTAITLTFSGSGYTSTPQPLMLVGSNEMTAGNISIVRTTAGVDGRFISGSLIGWNDGSQVPISFISDDPPTGVMVVSTDLSTSLSVPFPYLPVAGVVIATNLLPVWPSDPSLQAWIFAQLNTYGKFIPDYGY